jgi:ankyrin repeat protein
LLQYNCDPNLLDNSGASALDMACERQHFDCITALLTGGSSTTIVGHDGYTVIHRVVVNQQIKVFELFLKFGCDMYSMDGNGQTPIQLAIRCGNEDMLESLLNFGIDPNQLEMSGLTLVHMASFEGNYKALSLMIKHGGYVNNMDETEYQYTPLDYAILNGETKCINFLKEQGGLTILDIKTTAAVCIQSHIRKYQAKKLLEVMKQSKQAAICIQKNIRGFLARRNHLIHLQRCKAAIKIQAALRGFIARRIFRNSLQVYYEEKEKREDMKKFGMSLLDIKANLQTITIECNIQPTTIEKTRLQKNLYEKTERSFMLFDQYAFVNAEWKKFGIGEKQRQDNVKKQREKEILMKTVHDCQERKNYITEKFKHSKTVRSHQQAAQIIQQAYFKSKERQRKYIENEKHKFQRKLAYQMDAAKVIQRSWRHYRDWKLFENDHLSPVNTGPVLNLPHNITNSDSTTFRRKTLISGNSRRQLHSTNKAGFMVFKNISMATDIPHVTVTKNKLCMMTPNSRTTQLQNHVYTS